MSEKTSLSVIDNSKTMAGECGGSWQYECRPRAGTCRIDGESLWMNLKLEAWTDSPPDVLAVERWFAELLATPTTVEEVAVAARKKWGMIATASGTTATHGRIQFRVPA